MFKLLLAAGAAAFCLAAMPAQAVTMTLSDDPSNAIADGPVYSIAGIYAPDYRFNYTFDDFTADQQYEWNFVFQNVSARILDVAVWAGFQYAQNAGLLVASLNGVPFTNVGTEVFLNPGGMATLTLSALNPRPNKYGQPVTIYAEIEAVPLPAALPLLGTGLGGLWVITRRRKSKAEPQLVPHPGAHAGMSAGGNRC